MNQNERREFLRNKDLEMSKQVYKIIKESQPLPPKDIQPLLLKPVYPNIELTGTPEYRANKQMTDLLLAQQLENTVADAMNALTGTQTVPTVNKVPQTMMDEYIKANEIDVNADQKTLYNPIQIPVVRKPVPKPLPFGKLITQAEYENEKGRLINLYEVELEQRERIQDAEDNITDLINDGNFGGVIAFDEAARRDELNDKAKYKTNADLIAFLKSLDPSLKPGRTRGEIINKIISFEKGENLGLGEIELKRRLADVQNDLLTNEQNILQFENDMKSYEALYQRQLRTIEENRITEKNYEAEVHQVAEELLDNFNLLNTGKIKIKREPGETDDELMKRIDNLSKAPVNPANIENQIKLKTFNTAKKNVLELTPERDKAETVVKSLDIAEQDALNKMFPKIKEEFKKNFGLNNKSLSDDDITQFIKNQITTGSTLFTAPAAEPAVEEAKPVPKTDIGIAYLKLYTKQLQKDRPELRLRILKTKPELIQQLVDKNAWNEDDIRGYIEYLKTQPAEAVVMAEAQVAERLDGKGLKSQVFPQNFVFGKISIDLNKLFYQNILSIKQHNGHKILGHRNKRVSDNFIDVIFKMIDDKPISQSDLKNIKDERLLYDNLIVQSGLHKSKSIPTTIEQTSQEMKNRLGLIVGEIEAGNSNKSLLAEVHELLFKMVRVHLISKSAATKYFNNLKTEFYTLNPDLK
jgi:hypothetical protein